ncbi:MAG: hypothetical protein HUJ90_03410, partial [Bacteroidales bacterium]|nr:hypothetical protein [Bacteroidales bacterium]
CAARGRKIVADAWPALKPGGLLFYSTCTFNRFENDENVKWIADNLGAEIVKIMPFESSIPISTEYGLQFAPGITRGEGLYCAVLRKNGNAEHMSLRNYQIKCYKTDLVKQGYVAVNQNGLIKAYPPALINEMKFLEEKLRPLYSGVDVAQQKGCDIVPQPELALSKVMNDEVYPVVQLTKEQALNYLRHNLNSIPDAPTGFVTMAYNGIRLGFAKNLGSRMNIIHPVKWRLLK